MYTTEQYWNVNYNFLRAAFDRRLHRARRDERARPQRVGRDAGVVRLGGLGDGATSAPSRAARSAISRPTPRLPPETKTVLFARRM